ncbi:hypothetical protein CEUSTIGMA_g9119.t1 [Chlamydomonas eustigma]|uniref:Uncharacterized protein n=1 Tax=Chlamydomonas eustigma TaxID=1157962 RepID=A0A250XF51_9CHLO|nr:hypothetical protein CEUSTIGMA_g9119.t1 [Chlamydomonas eustigma]|eukprot:GAX81691.1 hypothetical protein CEUSTIGMA_g9119.t1 [Chlamydomonas eustigma]
MDFNERHVRQKMDEALGPPQTSESTGVLVTRFEDSTDLSDVRDKTHKQLEGLILRSEISASPSHSSQSGIESQKAPSVRGTLDANKSSSPINKPRITYTKRCEVEGCTKGAKRSMAGCCRFCKAHMKAAGLVPLETHLHCAQEGCTRFAKASSEGVWRYCKAHMQLHGMWPRDYNPDRRPRSITSATTSATQPASPKNTSISSGAQASRTLVQSLTNLVQMQKMVSGQGTQQQQQQPVFPFTSLPMSSSHITTSSTSPSRKPQPFLRGLDLATGTFSAGSSSSVDAKAASLQISTLNLKANSEPLQFLRMQGDSLQQPAVPATESISEPLPRVLLDATATGPKNENVLQQVAAPLIAGNPNPALYHLSGATTSSDLNQFLCSILNPAPQHEVSANALGLSINIVGGHTVYGSLTDAPLSSLGSGGQVPILQPGLGGPVPLLQPGISLQTLQKSGLSASTIMALLQQQQQQQQQDMALLNMVRPGRSGPIVQQQQDIDFAKLLRPGSGPLLQQQQQQQQHIDFVNLLRPGPGPLLQQQQEVASSNLTQLGVSPSSQQQQQQQLHQDTALTNLLKANPGLMQQQQYQSVTNLILPGTGTLPILQLMPVQGASSAATSSTSVLPMARAVSMSLLDVSSLHLQDQRGGSVTPQAAAMALGSTLHGSNYAVNSTTCMDVDATPPSTPASLEAILKLLQSQQLQK